MTTTKLIVSAALLLLAAPCWAQPKTYDDLPPEQKQAYDEAMAIEEMYETWRTLFNRVGSSGRLTDDQEDVRKLIAKYEAGPHAELKQKLTAFKQAYPDQKFSDWWNKTYLRDNLDGDLVFFENRLAELDQYVDEPIRQKKALFDELLANVEEELALIERTEDPGGKRIYADRVRNNQLKWFTTWFPDHPKAEELTARVNQADQSADAAKAAKLDDARWPEPFTRWTGPGDPDELAAAAKKFLQENDHWGQFKEMRVEVRKNWGISERNILGQPVEYVLAIWIGVRDPEQAGIVNVFQAAVVTELRADVKMEPPFRKVFVHDSYPMKAEHLEGGLGGNGSPGAAAGADPAEVDAAASETEADAAAGASWLIWLMGACCCGVFLAGAGGGGFFAYQQVQAKQAGVAAVSAPSPGAPPPTPPQG